MTRVANSVIVTDAYDEELHKLITSKLFRDHAGERPQPFEYIHMNGRGDRKYLDTQAGGSVFFETHVFAAAFNHVNPYEVADWFVTLPWREWDSASLTIHGNDENIFAIAEEGQCQVFEYPPRPGAWATSMSAAPDPGPAAPAGGEGT